MVYHNNSGLHTHSAVLLTPVYPPSDRVSIFVCRYWYCDSVREIAKRFGFSAGKVKSALFRMREKLSLHLEKEGFTVGRG